MPDERIEITLRYEDKKTRLIGMTAFGRHHTQVLKKTAGELGKIADNR